MRECAECGRDIEKGDGVHLSSMNDNNVSGPLWFCSEDHKEDYRENHPEMDAIRKANPELEQDHPKVEYGDSVDE